MRVSNLLIPVSYTHLVPFGATASAQIKNSSQITGIVGDNGQLYLSGLPLEGVINIQWGDGVQQKCQANYKLPETELDNPVSYATLEMCIRDRHFRIALWAARTSFWCPAVLNRAA